VPGNGQSRYASTDDGYVQRAVQRRVTGRSGLYAASRWFTTTISRRPGA
jgi:hypothetical protein